ncbi:MAG TPA: radical SAM family heme chaperone HemW [Chryseosolibacter sp.]
MAGIYFHIPFCKQACHYCDFHFSTNLSIREDLVEAMVKELHLQQHYLTGEQIETIYFGGGTPSLIPVSNLRSLIATVKDQFNVKEDAEITLECNPDDLSTAHLDEFFRIGVNRLSIGIQTFDDEVLRFLNRAHTAIEATEAVIRSRQAGFTNISIDLIYAIPGQTQGDWLQNIKRAIDLNPEHISAYNLTIEPQTVFGNWSKRGKLQPVVDDAAAAQLEALVSILAEAGYQQYEVSNFCKPGFESRHNSSYWQRKAYLGIGPSAHSYNRATRQYNVRNNHAYVKALRSGTVPFEREELKRDDQVNEYLLTTLRTVWGANLQVMRDDYGYDLLNDQKTYIQYLLSNGLATLDEHVLKLTQKGKMMADKISSDLFLIS